MSSLRTRAFKATYLRQLRKKKGLSQGQLGAKIGAHVTSISDWERGAGAPSGRHVASLARELEVPADSFYGDADGEPRSVSHTEMLTALAVALQPFLPTVEVEA